MPFPFFIDPGVNLTLYLYFCKEMYGAQTGTAKSKLSSGNGNPVKVSNTVKLSYKIGKLN